MRFIFEQDCQINLQIINVICRLLFHEGEGDIHVKLIDWNNNHGFEFDVLQSVFPTPISLFGTAEFVANPITHFKSKSRSLELFFFVAVSVDAAFQISTKNAEIKLDYCDTILRIACPSSVEKIILQYLTTEASMQRIDD